MEKQNLRFDIYQASLIHKQLSREYWEKLRCYQGRQTIENEQMVESLNAILLEIERVFPALDEQHRVLTHKSIFKIVEK